MALNDQQHRELRSELAKKTKQLDIAMAYLAIFVSGQTPDRFDDVLYLMTSVNKTQGSEVEMWWQERYYYEKMRQMQNTIDSSAERISYLEEILAVISAEIPRGAPYSARFADAIMEADAILVAKARGVR